MGKKVSVIAVGTILFLGIGYFNFLKPKKELSVAIQSSQMIEASEVIKKDKKISVTTIDKKIAKSINSNIPYYKDIFKEPREISTLEQIQTEDEIKKIEKESKELISEADELIKNNNLVLAEEKLTAKQQEQLEEYNIQMDGLKEELEELSNDKSK